MINLNTQELYKDLRLHSPKELNQFIVDLIESLTEVGSDRGITYSEVRTLLERHFDSIYDPNHRHLEFKPTQREVNFALEVMLSRADDDKILCEKNDLIYLASGKD